MTDSNTPVETGTADAQPLSEQDIISQIGKDVMASEEEHAGASEPEATEGETTDEESNASGDEAESQEDDAQEGEEAETEAAKEPDANVSVKLDDGSTVTLGELKKGYLRQSDYTRKTQEVSGQRQQIEAAAQRLIEADTQVRQTLEMAVAVVQARLPKPPDTALINTDPSAYLLQKEIFEQTQAELQRLVSARDQAAQRVQQTQGATYQQAVQAELNALAEKVPEFRSAEKRAAFLQDAVPIAERAYGLTAEEIGSIVDHREIMILRDAIAYRKLQSQKMEVVRQAKTAPPLKPAARPAPGAQTARDKQAAVDRLRQSGSIEDFVRVASLEKLIS